MRKRKKLLVVLVVEVVVLLLLVVACSCLGAASPDVPGEPIQPDTVPQDTTGQIENVPADTAADIDVLEDETTVVEVNGKKLRFCGVENLWDENAEKELGDIYSVLLYHYPSDFPIMSKKGYDLILAGHAHGGQWRIPGLVNGLFSPDEWFFPKYAGGFYSENGTDMIVSRGLYKNISCLWMPRIFNRPELVLITLK